MDDNSHSQTILIVSTISLAASLLSVGLRCFVRFHILHAFGRDDSLMVIAMILYLGFSICGMLGAKFGVGEMLAYFDFKPNNLRRALLCWWISEILYAITCVMIKISIILTLLRLTISHIHIWILYAAITFASAVGLVFLAFTIFQCSPVDYFWNKGSTAQTGTCISTNLLVNISYFYSASAAVTDLTIALVSVALIWNLRMDRRNKFAVIGILCIGCIASVAVIIRIPFLHHYKDREFFYNTYQIGIWSYIEAGLGIIAGSLATLRPLGHFLWRRSSTSRNYHHSRGSFPLSRDQANEHRSVSSKNKIYEDEYQLWGGGGLGNHHDVTIVALGNMATSSEEILSPANTSNRSEDERSDLNLSLAHASGTFGAALDSHTLQ